MKCKIPSVISTVGLGNNGEAMRSTLSAFVFCGALGLAAVVQPGLAQDDAVDEVAKKECHLFGVTWDGGSKAAALNRAQTALKKSHRRMARQAGQTLGMALGQRHDRSPPYEAQSVLALQG